MEAVGQASLDFSGYCRLAAQAMLQAAMEIEAAEFIGRASYERRGEGQSAYRNGYKRRRVATGEGPLELLLPQTRNGAEPFQTAILGAFQRRSEVLGTLIPQLYVKGLSVRDISDTFRQVLEDEGVSPATARRLMLLATTARGFSQRVARQFLGPNFGRTFSLRPSPITCDAV